MSGAFGWNRNSGGGPSRASNTNFDDAFRGYGPGGTTPQPPQQPAKPQTPPPVTPQSPANRSPTNRPQPSRPQTGPVAGQSPTIDTRKGKNRQRETVATGTRQTAQTAFHTVSSTAKTLIIVALDSTGSFKDWWNQIYQRLPLLWEELTILLGSDDIELLFLSFGDAKSNHAPLQVGKLARGPETDLELSKLFHEGGGGGDEQESPELAAYYALTRVDTGSAQNVFFFTLTDEAGANEVSPAHVQAQLGQTLDRRFTRTSDLYQALRVRMHVNTILVDSRNREYSPARIAEWWNTNLPNGVIRLNTAERVVDTMLLTIGTALSPKHSQLVMSRLSLRQQGKQHGEENLETMGNVLSQLQTRPSGNSMRADTQTDSPTKPIA